MGIMVYSLLWVMQEFISSTVWFRAQGFPDPSLEQTRFSRRDSEGGRQRKQHLGQKTFRLFPVPGSFYRRTFRRRQTAARAERRTLSEVAVSWAKAQTQFHGRQSTAAAWVTLVSRV